MTQKDQQKNQQKDQYAPDVYKRLALVEKQFAVRQADQRRQEAAERRRQKWASLGLNRQKTGRIALYAVLGILLLAVIIILVRSR